MTDYPIEQEQHDNLLANVRTGTVLIGGLGLGYAATILACRRRIKKVIVVEKAPEVIALVKDAMINNLAVWANKYPRAHRKVEVVKADLFEFLGAASSSEPFDFAYYDIWQSDGEITFHDTVVPLLRLSQGKVRGRPICWNEGVMRGQLFTSLQGRVLAVPGVFEDGSKLGFSIDKLATRLDESDRNAMWINWSVPFFEWVRDAKPDRDIIIKGAEVYASIYGLLFQEARWSLFCKGK